MGWFKGFVAVLIAFTFTACFIGVLHYTSFERQHSHDYSHEHSNQDNGGGNEVKPTLETPIPVFNGIPAPSAADICEGAEQNSPNQGLSDADHYSQIVMAFFTFGGLIIGGYGLYFIWRTVEYTRKASEDARNALTESKKMTALVIQEQRPWIYIDRSVECDFAINENGVVRLTWFKTIQNIGKTPAYDFRFAQELIKTDNIFHTDEEIESFKERLINKMDGSGGEVIIPNQPNRSEPIFGQINSLLEHVKGEGDKYMLITGCIYRISIRGPIGYDIQIYNVSPRRNGGIIGPMTYELIHDQFSRQVQ